MIRHFTTVPTSLLALCTIAGSTAKAADLATPKAPAPETCKATLSFPAYGGVIKQNPNPACFTVPGFGDVYVGGALTGYSYTQSRSLPFSPAPLPSDRGDRVDVSNIQGFVQKTDGTFQFYVQAGAYAIPALGVVNYGVFD